MIKVNDGNIFKEKNLILKQFYNSFSLLGKEKVECASIVPFYKDKILLMYDHKYKHYILPQGHKEQKESLEETATREMREETGFNKLRVIKKIKKYQYHYPDKRKTIYKTIHVFLVEILSIRQEKKKLEKHENYSNRFFTITGAINKARWTQDKKVIASSMQLIKKSPHF